MASEGLLERLLIELSRLNNNLERREGAALTRQDERRIAESRQHIGTTHPLDRPWMRLPEVCDYSACGRTVVLAALNSGELRGTQVTAKGMWRIHRDNVDAWLHGGGEQPPQRVSTRRRGR